MPILAEVAARLGVGVGVSKARRLAHFHERCLAELTVYAAAAAEVASRCVLLIEDGWNPGAPKPGTGHSQS